MRPLLIFFLLGSALFGLKRSLGADRPLPLRVHVRAGANAHEIDQAVERALLAELGLKASAPLHDPVIRERLIASLSEPEKPVDERALLRQADQLGLWHEDALIEVRLALVGELRLRSGLAIPEPTDAALLAYRDAHPERYRRPARVSFAQVFLAREKHAAELSEHAAALRARLVAEHVGPAGAHNYGEASNLPTRVAEASLSSVASRFGEEFAQALSQLEAGAWSMPLPSAFGVHLVWLIEQSPAGLLELAQARGRLMSDYREHATRQAVARRLNALRANYAPELVP
jgi:hypothetical protein